MKTLAEQLETIQERNPMMFSDLKRLITSTYVMVEHSAKGMNLAVVVVESEKIRKAAKGIIYTCDCYKARFDCGNCEKNCEECC